MYRNETINKLQAAINAVWNNEYNNLYQTHWRQAGITTCPTITNIAELQQLPPVNKDFFITARTKGINTFIPPQKHSMLHSSSGSTSGAPFFVWKSYGAVSAHRILRQYGTKRMLTIWNYSKTAIRTLSVRSVGIESVAVDPHQLPYCEELLQTEMFDTLDASSSIATMLPQYFKNVKLLEQFKMLYLGGEVVTPDALQLLRAQYPAAQISSGFACAECTGIIGFHMSDCGEDHNILHVSDEEFIVDSNATNELAITLLNSPSSALPLIRYQTGDSGILLKEPCACGLDTPRFKITGRSNVDFVRIRGMEIRIEYFQAALVAFSTELKPVIHVTVHETRVSNRIVALLDIQLVLRDGSKDTPSLREHILHALDAVLLSPRVTLKRAIETDIFAPPRLTFATDYIAKDKNKSIKLIV